MHIGQWIKTNVTFIIFIVTCIFEGTQPALSSLTAKITSHSDYPEMWCQRQQLPHRRPNNYSHFIVRHCVSYCI